MSPIYVLFFLHWVADFACQTGWMANNKSSNIYALLTHVLVYTLVLGSGVLLLATPSLALWTFIALNFCLHFVTDMWTSKVTKYFWESKQVHNFFTTIGFDQMIHNICLVASWNVLLG